MVRYISLAAMDWALPQIVVVCVEPVRLRILILNSLFANGASECAGGKIPFDHWMDVPLRVHVATGRTLVAILSEFRLQTSFTESVSASRAEGDPPGCF